MKRFWVILMAIFFLVNPLVFAETENKTIVLSSNLDQVLFIDTEYTSLFKIEIKDKKPCSPKDTITVFYNITKEDLLIKKDFFSKEVGCTTAAATGNFIPLETGNYTFCGEVRNEHA